MEAFEVPAATPKKASQYQQLSTSSSPNDLVWIFGIVTAVRKSKNALFADVRHIFGSHQIIAEKAKFEDRWVAIRTIKSGDRIRVNGILGSSISGTPSILVSEYMHTTRSLVSLTLADTELAYRATAAAILIARARRAAEDFLYERSYSRVDPKYLSVSWPEGQGMSPLAVSYPGFGAPVFLSPSPAQQLLSVLANTGEDKVFCSSTSFTSDYRSPTDGNESAIVMTRTAGIGRPDLQLDALDLLNAVCTKLPGVDIALPIKPIEIDDRHETRSDTKEAASYFVDVDSTDDISPFKLILKGEVSPIEGCIEQVHGGLPIGTFVFHIERMLPLAQHVPLRTLRHLGSRPGVGLQ